jgi:hypothetical protein
MTDNIQYVSRNHAQIALNENVLTMQAIARQDEIIYLNNEPCNRDTKILHPGDTISLIGSLKYFNFRVEIDSSNVSKTAQTSKKRKPEEIIEIRDDHIEKKKSKPTTNGDSSIFTNASASEVEIVSLLSSSSSNHNNNNNGGVVSLKGAKSSNPFTNAFPPATTPTVEEIILLDDTSSTTTGHAESSSSNNNNNNNQESNTPKMKEVVQNLLRQYECSICYETMACAIAIIPCGDTFCFPCIYEWSIKHKTCPSCQGLLDLKVSIPNRISDNAVHEILKNETIELQTWETRTNEGLKMYKNYKEGKHVYAERETSKNNNNNNAGGGGGGSVAGGSASNAPIVSGNNNNNNSVFTFPPNVHAVQQSGIHFAFATSSSATTTNNNNNNNTNQSIQQNRNRRRNNDVVDLTYSVHK